MHLINLHCATIFYCNYGDNAFHSYIPVVDERSQGGGRASGDVDLVVGCLGHPKALPNGVNAPAIHIVQSASNDEVGCHLSQAYLKMECNEWYEGN